MPRDQSETPRKAILRHLRSAPASARDLSGLVGIAEKEIIGHLEHLRRSLRRGPERLTVLPAECIACGFVFVRRTRLTRPSACPRCRAERIEAPTFLVEPST
jgi:predicted Zn-ribbon and HTH transcriptional regulator